MGFFFEEVKNKASKKEKIPDNVLISGGCSLCPLNFKKDINKLDPSGTTDAEVYVVGEKPTKDDNLSLKPFSGKIGNYVKSLLHKLDVKTRQNQLINCYTSSITKVNISCCSSRIISDIEKTKPKLILGIGSSVFSTFVKTAYNPNMNGKLFPITVGNHTCWYYSIIDPIIAISKRRNENKKSSEEKILELHIKTLHKLLPNLKPPKIENDFYKNIEIITGVFGQKDFDKLKKAFDKLLNLDHISIDLETTAFRPYGEKILTCSVGTYDYTVAFPIHHPNGWRSPDYINKVKNLLRFLLKSSKVVVAHNLLFEQEWLSCLYDDGIHFLDDVSWGDTYAQSYIMDSRKKLHSLDFLCVKNFGFSLKGLTDVKPENWKNYKIEDLLLYNALDTKYTSKLFKKQKKEIEDEGLVSPYNLLIKTSKALVKAQVLGVVPNLEKVEYYSTDLGDKLNNLDKRILSLEEVKTYNISYGRFNPLSNPNVIKLLNTSFGINVTSAKEEILSEIDNDFSRLILEYRSISKLKSTYIDSIKELSSIDGKIHTQYLPYFVITGRTSSRDPNTQNFPSRKRKDVRSVVGCPQDYYMVAADYGQIEARVVACIADDASFQDAIWNDYDIHMHWAHTLADMYPRIIGGRSFMDDKKKMKNLRSVIKNKFVFPVIYGSSAYSISNSLKVPLNIIEGLLDDFWSTFKGIKKWQTKISQFYEKHGYIKTANGRKIPGPLSLNDIYNYPIQGTASDFLTHSGGELSLMSRSIDDCLIPRLYIHDDMTFYIPKDNFEFFYTKIAETMCMAPFNEFDFLNVPLSVEMEYSDVGWYPMKPLKTFTSVDFGLRR